MKAKYNPHDIVFAINTYSYKDETYRQDFYRIEKVIIESINIDINSIEYWVNDIITGISWGDCVSENRLFKTKELAAKELLKLCEL